MERRTLLRLAAAAWACPIRAGRVVAAEPAGEMADPAAQISWAEIAREVALNVLPERHRDDRHWNRTERITTGVRVKTKGGGVRLEPREKRVNHGFWRRFTIWLIDPERTFRLELRNVRKTEQGGTRLDLVVGVRARCEAQFAMWTYDVKGLNGTIQSDNTVQAVLDLSFKVESEFQEGGLLPVFLLKPEFHDLKLKLTDVDTRKIGAVGGWMAEELGDGTRKVFEEVLQSQEKPLLERLRKSLAKKRDRLKLDPADVGKLFGK